MLAETIVELERREAVVRRIDDELRTLGERLRRSIDGGPMRAGNARRLVATEQQRRRLAASIGAVERRRAEAWADVERARERRRRIEEELAERDDGAGSSSE